MQHNLKTWPIFFEMVRSGRKRFELRKDDRGFRIGDLLVLQEFDPSTETYSGRELHRGVSDVIEMAPLYDGVCLVFMSFPDPTIADQAARIAELEAGSETLGNLLGSWFDLFEIPYRESWADRTKLAQDTLRAQLTAAQAQNAGLRDALEVVKPLADQFKNAGYQGTDHYSLAIDSALSASPAQSVAAIQGKVLRDVAQEIKSRTHDHSQFGMSHYREEYAAMLEDFSDQIEATSKGEKDA